MQWALPLPAAPCRSLPHPGPTHEPPFRQAAAAAAARRVSDAAVAAAVIVFYAALFGVAAVPAGKRSVSPGPAACASVICVNPSQVIGVHGPAVPRGAISGASSVFDFLFV